MVPANLHRKPAADESEKISLDSLSELTGFPLEFIKKELILQDDKVSLEDLRAAVLKYLQLGQSCSVGN